MIDANRHLEPTPHGAPALGRRTTEVILEGCEQHGPAERVLAAAVREAAESCPPGDDDAVHRAIEPILTSYNGAVAARRGEPVPDGFEMTFAGYLPVIKVRFHDGLGARWGFDVAGRKESYLGVFMRGRRPEAPPENVRAGVWAKTVHILTLGIK